MSLQNIGLMVVVRQLNDEYRNMISELDLPLFDEKCSSIMMKPGMFVSLD